MSLLIFLRSENCFCANTAVLSYGNCALSPRSGISHGVTITTVWPQCKRCFALQCPCAPLQRVPSAASWRRAESQRSPKHRGRPTARLCFLLECQHLHPGAALAVSRFPLNCNTHFRGMAASPAVSEPSQACVITQNCTHVWRSPPQLICPKDG